MPDRSTVLIVADHEIDCRALVGVLSNQPAYEVVGPLPALEALRFCATATPVVAFVHAELRDITAVELCALMRARANGTPFPSLLFGPAPAGGFQTALPSGLETLIRQAARNVERPVDQYRGRHLRAHFNRVEVLVDDARIDLTPRELALLQFLVTHANRVLGRADLLDHVWHNENDGRSRTVDVHIRRLRMKLGLAGKQIQTVPRLGYRFSED